MDYKRHNRRQYWSNLFIDVAEHMQIPYLDLMRIDVIEFFYIMKRWDKKMEELKLRNPKK